jgi:hypothetical protein
MKSVRRSSQRRRAGALGVSIILAAALSAPLAARAEDGAFAPRAAPGGGFGAPGQWVISGDFNAHFNTGDRWQIRVHPALDYFLVPNVSVGGVFGLSYTSGDANNPSQTNIDVGARAGFNLNINDRMSFWPTAGIFVSHVSGHPDTNTTTLGIFAPFLFDLAPHLFIGVGPSFSLGLAGGAGNGWGIDTTVGGWF